MKKLLVSFVLAGLLLVGCETLDEQLERAESLIAEGKLEEAEELLHEIIEETKEDGLLVTRSQAKTYLSLIELKGYSTDEFASINNIEEQIDKYESFKWEKLIKRTDESGYCSERSWEFEDILRDSFSNYCSLIVDIAGLEALLDIGDKLDDAIGGLPTALAPGRYTDITPEYYEDVDVERVIEYCIEFMEDPPDFVYFNHEIKYLAKGVELFTNYALFYEQVKSIAYRSAAALKNDNNLERAHHLFIVAALVGDQRVAHLIPNKGDAPEGIDYRSVADLFEADLELVIDGSARAFKPRELVQDSDIREIEKRLNELHSHINNILYDYYRGSAFADLMERGYQGDAVAEAIRIAEERVAKEEAEADDMYDEIASMIKELRRKES